MAQNLISFYGEVGRLKGLTRTGWKRRNIENPESVAEHTYRAMFIAMDLARAEGIDPLSCMQMMLIHDLQEGRVGDFTPHCGVSREQKAALELQAAKDLAALRGDDEFLNLFLEFEKRETPRAKVCNDADQLEAVLQAMEYAWRYPDKAASLEEFWPYAKARLMTRAGHKLFDALMQEKATPQVGQHPTQHLHP